ncbi:MAG: hypothetical protein WC289_00760 [Patescibacteria group bacterium]|jgi:hypothetical protein
MIPATEIRYNYDYAKRLYTGSRDFGDIWQDIIKHGANLELVYEQVYEKIMKAIPQLTGYEWGEEYTDPFIPIYLVDADESFARPFTVSVDEDTSMMLVDVLLQFVHLNLRYGFRLESERDGAIQYIASKVAEAMGIDLEETFADHADFLAAKHGAAYRTYAWDLAKHPARYYLDQQ